MQKIKFILLILTLSISLFSFKSTPNSDKSLNKFCIDCHIVYPAEFLPSRSWNLLFEEDSLDNHFGKTLLLEDDIKKRFLVYYLKYSAENSKKKIGRIVNRSIPKSSTPTRITKVPFIQDTHEDLKDEMVLDNPKVRFYANCSACHGDNAKKGIFDEDDVKIPGYKKFIKWWIKE